MPAGVEYEQRNIFTWLTGTGILILLSLATHALTSATIYFPGIRASRTTFASLVRAVARAPQAVFDTTPFTRILNRSSWDQARIDDGVGSALQQVNSKIASITIAFVLQACVLGWASLVYLPILLFVTHINVRYRVAVRDCKRLELTAISKVLRQLVDVYEMATISRAMQWTTPLHTYLGSSDGDVATTVVALPSPFHRYVTAFWSSTLVTSWYVFTVALVSTIVSGCITLVAIVMVRTSPVGSYSGAFLALAVAYSMQMVAEVTSVAMALNTLELQMVSVERNAEYVHDLPREAVRTDDDKPDADVDDCAWRSMVDIAWPQSGAFEFRDVELRYRPGLPLALKGVSFAVAAAEHVGVVGRTGSGKTSLINSMLRMVELAGGTITIDGVEVRQASLYELRSRIGVVMQDPLLFLGTLGENLDPLHLRGESELKEALLRVGLAASNDEAAAIVQSKVEVGGENMSNGRRQLVCLARVLLQRTKIILLDEATSSLDAKTDRRVQHQLMEMCDGITTLSVAHRMQTVIDCDQVIILGGGIILEKGSPTSLASNPQSRLAQLQEASRSL